MEGGQVAWPADADWRDTLETELLAFPHGRHDDIVDCLAYAATELARGAYQPVTISIPQGTLRYPWHRDPAEEMAARLGATFYDSQRDTWPWRSTSR